MVRIVGSLCNGLICTDSARSMKEDAFGIKRIPLACAVRQVMQADGRRGMYVQYSTWEVAVKAVVVGTVGTYDERRYF